MNVRSFRRCVSVLPFVLAAIACDASNPIEPADSAPDGLAPAPRVDRTASSARLVPVATRPHLLVDAAWLQSHLDRPNVVVLHFGSRSVYDGGHVPGARLVSLTDVEEVQDGIPNMLRDPGELRAVLEAAGVSTSDRVIVTGDGTVAATRGFVALEYVGHPQVAMLDGGLPAWQATGGTLSTSAPAVWEPGRIRPPADPSTVVGTAEVQALLGDPAVALVDVRPIGAYATGHIPGAGNLPFIDLVESPSMPLFLDPATLRERFAAAGVDARDRVIVYCGSGFLSSMGYFAARYLGFDVSLYDGSMLAWNAAGMPVEQ